MQVKILVLCVHEYIQIVCINIQVSAIYKFTVYFIGGSELDSIWNPSNICRHMCN